MGPRYPTGPRPGVRMPQMGGDFNGVSNLNGNFTFRQKEDRLFLTVIYFF